MIPLIARRLLAALPLALASTLACAQDAASAASPAPDTASASPQDARRCGWLATHGGDTVLSDKDGDWLLARTGAPAAAGAWPPVFAAGQTVKTRDGVVACACMRVQAEPATHHVLAARDPQARPLAACRKDVILREAEPVLAARKTVRGTGFSISVPAQWEASRDGDCLSFDDPDTPLNQPMLSLCRKATTLAEEAEAAGFERGEDGAWIQPAGRFMRLPAWWMFASRWDAIYAIESVGISDETGYHAAAGAQVTFIASDGRRTLVVDAPGPIDHSITVLAALRTLRFDAAPASK